MSASIEKLHILQGSPGQQLMHLSSRRMVCLSDLPAAGSSDHRKVEHRGQVHPHVEHQREVPSRVTMKTMAMARALGKVQREVVSPSRLDSNERALGEGLEMYASGIDATAAIGYREDPKPMRRLPLARTIGGSEAGSGATVTPGFFDAATEMSQKRQSELLGQW